MEHKECRKNIKNIKNNLLYSRLFGHFLVVYLSMSNRIELCVCSAGDLAKLFGLHTYVLQFVGAVQAKANINSNWRSQACLLLLTPNCRHSDAMKTSQHPPIYFRFVVECWQNYMTYTHINKSIYMQWTGENTKINM